MLFRILLGYMRHPTFASGVGAGGRIPLVTVPCNAGLAVTLATEENAVKFEEAVDRVR